MVLCLLTHCLHCSSNQKIFWGYLLYVSKFSDLTLQENLDILVKNMTQLALYSRLFCGCVNLWCSINIRLPVSPDRRCVFCLCLRRWRIFCFLLGRLIPLLWHQLPPRPRPQASFDFWFVPWHTLVQTWYLLTQKMHIRAHEINNSEQWTKKKETLWVVCLRPWL